MSGCVNKAAGYVKRASGDFTPASGNDFYAADSALEKVRPADTVRMIGGGTFGAQPDEQGRFFFGPCRPCDIDLCIAEVSVSCPIYGWAGPQLASVGRAIVKVSRSPSFDSGYFAQLEAVVASLYIPSKAATGSANDPVYGPSTFMPLAYDLRLSDAAINDSQQYVETQWSSLVDASSGRGHEYDFPYTILGLPFFPRLSAGGVAYLTPRSMALFSYRVSVGQFSGESFFPFKTRATWATPREPSSQNAKLWLGFGESSICGGLGSYCVMNHELSASTVNEWRMATKYYAGQAKPGETTQITIQQPSFYGNASGNGTYSASGIGILSADGWSVDAKRMTLSPKASTHRSSLVSSAQDLLWSGGVMSGANAGHSRRAMVGYSTPWPFNQPEHSSAIAIGSAAASATKLRVTFDCNVSGERVNSFDAYGGFGPPSFNVDLSQFLKPKAIVTNNFSVTDEAGTYSSTVKQRPQNQPFSGAFDADDAIVQSLGQYDTLPGYGYPYTWATKKFDTYRLDIQQIDTERQPHLFFQGSFNLENKLPSGEASFPDLFSCSKSNDGQTLEAVPSLQLPYFSAVDSSRPWTVKTSGSTAYTGYPMYGGGEVVEAAATGIPRIVPKTQNRGRVVYGTGFGGYYSGTVDESAVSMAYEVTREGPRYGVMPEAAGWSVVSRTYTSSSTSTKTVIEATRTQDIVQLYSQANAPSSTPNPPSDFHKADPARLDDMMQRLCDATRWAVLKSCKWIPKQTQLFAYVKRNGQQYGGAESSQWPYYGGSVPAADQPQMLDSVSTAHTDFNNPNGASMFVAMRRTWVIEAEVAHGTMDYTASEVVSDTPQLVGPTPVYAGYFNQIGVQYRWLNTRRVRYAVEFNVNNCESVTHKTNQETWWRAKIDLSESEMQQLEGGQEVTIPPERLLKNTLTDQVGLVVYEAQAGLTMKLQFS